MPFYCAAVNCSNSYRKGSGITFHKFPLRDEQLLEKWLDMMRRDCWKPTKSSRICSSHFVETCFRYNNDRRYLQPNSVPTIFNFPLLQKITSKKSVTRKRLRQENLPDENKSNGGELEYLPSLSHDHSYYSSPSEAFERLKQPEKKCEQLKKKLRLCKQESRRKAEKITNLEDIIQGLRERLCRGDVFMIENCLR